MFNLDGILNSKRQNLYIFAALFLLTVVVRLPFIDLINEDEAFYSVVAQRWLGAEWPYAATFDVKPPMIFATLAVFQSVFGMHVWIVKLVEMASVAISAFAIWKILELFSQKKAGALAAILSIGFSLPLFGAYFPAQILQMTFTVLGVLFACRYITGSNRLELFAAGIFVGLAALTKQTAVFDGFALYLWMLLELRSRRFFTTALIYGFGVLSPILACGALFVLAGHGQEIWQAVVVMAVSRAELHVDSVTAVGPFGIVTRLAGLMASVAPILALVVVGVLSLTRWKRLAGQVDARLLRLLPIWIVLSALGVISSLLVQTWYAFPLIAPAVILAGLFIEYCLSFSGSRQSLKKIGVAGFLVATALFVERDSLSYGSFKGAPDTLAARRATAQLQALGMRPGDDLLVPIRGQSIYLMSGNYPKSKYFHAMHLLCDFKTPVTDPLGVALASGPKYIVLSDTNYFYGCSREAQVSRIVDEVRNKYERIGLVRGRWDTMVIYRRKSGSDT